MMRGMPARVQPMANGEMPLAWSRSDMQTGSATLVTDGTVSTKTITHGLGVVPGQVFIELGTANPYVHGVTNKTATSFVVNIHASATGNPPASGQTIPIDWKVVAP